MLGIAGRHQAQEGRSSQLRPSLFIWFAKAAGYDNLPRSTVYEASQIAAVEARWLTSTTVLPCRASSNARSTAASLRLSRLLVGSSSSTNGASCKNMRASPMRWRSPPDKVSPNSPTGVSNPCGRRSIKPVKAAFLQASASSLGVASGLASAMLSPTVPENRCVSCVM